MRKSPALPAHFPHPPLQPAHGAEERSKAAWRWRQLLLRARLDALIYADGHVDCTDAAQLAAFRELATLYYAQGAEQRVRPPCT